jgi:hypothetical protein
LASQDLQLLPHGFSPDLTQGRPRGMVKSALNEGLEVRNGELARKAQSVLSVRYDALHAQQTPLARHADALSLHRKA